MQPSSLRLISVLSLIFAAYVGYVWSFVAEEVATSSQREMAAKAQADGNFRDAYRLFREIALNPKVEPHLVGGDLMNGINCLQQLGQNKDVDEFREQVIAVHNGNWRLLLQAANSLFNGEHQGFIVAGKFERGWHRGGGRYVSSFSRDRVRALQLLDSAIPLVEKENDKDAAGQFYADFADAVMNGGGMDNGWRMQILSDLSQLPDYEDNWWYGGGGNGAPVNEAGEPVYHSIPKTYAESKSDGERWRWLLMQTGEVSPRRIPAMKLRLANFLYGQFDVHTMASIGFRFDDTTSEETEKESSILSLKNLKETETIAKLATGVKRFEIPEEFQYIKLYREVFEQDTDRESMRSAAGMLSSVFQNRRQYTTAAGILKTTIARLKGEDVSGWQAMLDQIVANWGQFDPIGAQPAGVGPVLSYKYRNGGRVEFEAHEIKIPTLLEDIKAYLKSNPQNLDWNTLSIPNIGHRIVQQNATKYLGERVAQWGMDLEPRPNHFDRYAQVTTPLQKPGAYLVVAKMKDGNISRLVVWVADLVIAKKPLAGKNLYYLADAVTGTPSKNANIEFFGWKQEQVGNTNKFQVLTKNFAEKSNADGMVFPQPRQQPQDYQWLAIAKQGKSLAFLGFTGVWYGQQEDQAYNQVKVYTITDRPVYRPDQTVNYKFWIRTAKYDVDDTKQFAARNFNIQINNPRGEQVYKETLKTDDFGGLEGKYQLPKDAPLGPYYVFIADNQAVSGGGSFRVEEYKKPEYEVTVEAPTEPVMLGEKITAKIQAKYFFGAPVTSAKVKYKVNRTTHEHRWYPTGRWDWFFGRGYWWFAYDYTWYPGWNEWGCFRPHPFWVHHWPAPPELVAEQEVPIGADGTVSVEIDTAIAKELHGDSDHQYEITAEVIDESRRTIVGSGNVMVARQPFRVFSWVNRGHYKKGDTIEASFQTQTISGKPVAGKGKLTLFKIDYDEKHQPKETAVETWNLDPNEEGEATQKMTAAAAGQYRLSYEVTDAKERTQEGGYIFVVGGDKFDGSDFRFNDIELVTDKREYAPGEEINLMINTDRVGSTVLLFLRPSNGVYQAPQVLRLTGKSTTFKVGVVQKDMPNFFLEAVTVSNGEIHQDSREVVVPPEKRILTVDVKASQDDYRPGADAKINIKLTDHEGKPFVGSTVLTMYDKSVEYISGGSNVPEIKDFFWKWRRSHYPQIEHSLQLSSYLVMKENEVWMQTLGVFGDTAEDELLESELFQTGSPKSGATRGFAGGLGRRSTKGRADGAMLGNRMEQLAKTPMAANELAAEGFDKGDGGGLGGGGPGGQPPAETTVRKNFADTAIWVGNLTTNEAGEAEVSLKMPENLTGWKIRTWAIGAGTRCGEGTAEVVTSKKLMVRLQAPRFFTEKDEVVLSANIHNHFDTDQQVKAILELEGDTLSPMGDAGCDIMVKAHGEQRVDWRVKVTKAGEALVRMKALSTQESDAMEMRFPVYVHGILKTVAYSGMLRPETTSGQIEFVIPEERKPEQSRIEVRYSPTLAGALVDALPYLVYSPYKTTDVTVSRFLPTVVTQKILQRLGVDLKAVKEKRTNLNAQEIGDPQKRAEGWHHDKEQNPVFDAETVDLLSKEGVQTLTEMQLADGGWGWFSGFGEHSSPHTTALVVHGLILARQNDVGLVPDVLENGVAWLQRYRDGELQKLRNAPGKVHPYKLKADNLDALVFMVLDEANEANVEMRDYLYRDRNELSLYAKAMYGLALHHQNELDKLKMIMQNLDQYVTTDKENQTAYLDYPQTYSWWYWYGSEIEANAFYLKLLSRVEPEGERAAWLVKYLLNNRKHGSYWNSTRDTAFAIEAMAEFLVASRESNPDLKVEIWLDGKKAKEVAINKENLFSFDGTLVLEGDAVTTGTHQIEFRKQGTGPLYFNAYVTNFTLEDPITKAGLEIKVERKFYKLVREEKEADVAGSRGQALKQKVEKFRREPLENLASLKSGDLVEVELEIESKNDYEYLLFEDRKPAGFEPVDQRSGYVWNSLGAYQELRDERVAYYVRMLPRGKHSVSYRVRAEIPGKYSALPAKGIGIYAPELVGNSDEWKTIIND